MSLSHPSWRVYTIKKAFTLQIVRQDVYTDINVVPVLPLRKHDSLGRVQRLNSYALDFFKHGSAKCIEKENRFVTNTITYSNIGLFLLSVYTSCMHSFVSYKLFSREPTTFKTPHLPPPLQIPNFINGTSEVIPKCECGMYGTSDTSKRYFGERNKGKLSR